MSENSKIEWTDHTFNPWIGCTKVSPGCDHCYAERDMAVRLKVVQWGSHGERVRTKPANWAKPLVWNRRHDEFFAQYGRRQRVFCASLADVFDNAVDPSWRQDLAHLILDTPDLDWLLLTKRIGNAGDMLSEMFLDGAPENLWLGASIVNQLEADRDIPKLLKVAVSTRFLSMEPLLGPVDLTRLLPINRNAPCTIDALTGRTYWPDNDADDGPPLDWIIVGGESGPEARPMHPEWARDLRDQCADAGVPFLFKQWGEWTPGENVNSDRGTVDIAHWFVDEWRFGRENLASFGGHIDDQPDLYRIGKKAAGRLLDGMRHDGYPSVQEGGEAC